MTATLNPGQRNSNRDAQWTSRRRVPGFTRSLQHLIVPRC